MKKGWPSKYDGLTSKQRREKEELRYVHVSSPLRGVDENGKHHYDFGRGRGDTYKTGRNKAKAILKGNVL